MDTWRHLVSKVHFAICTWVFKIIGSNKTALWQKRNAYRNPGKIHFIISVLNLFHYFIIPAILGCLTFNIPFYTFGRREISHSQWSRNVMHYLWFDTTIFFRIYDIFCALWFPKSNLSLQKRRSLSLLYRLKRKLAEKPWPAEWKISFFIAFVCC